MHWILPALTAPFINAINNFIDKYLVSGSVKNPDVLPVYFSIVGFLVGTAVWIYSGFFIPGIYALFGIGSGITTVVAGIAYFKLMRRRDVSEMIFLLELTPLFLLALSYLFLGQRISTVQLAGFILIFLAAAAVNFRKEESRLRWSVTMWLAVVLCGMWAIGGILVKLAIDNNSYLNSITYDGWGMGIGALILCALSPSVRKDFVNNFRGLKKRTLVFFGLDQALAITSRWVEYFAYSIGPVALVSVVGGTQTFYCILMGYALTLAIPGVFREDISGKTIIRKLIAAAVLAAGLYFVYI